MCDEYDPRPAIAVRPTVEPGHCVQEMLCTLNHRRPAGFLGDIYESLDAQKCSAKILGDPVQQELYLLARQRTLAYEHEILDSSAFEMMTVHVARMIMPVMIMIVAERVMIARIVLMIRLDIEPRPGIRPCVGRVETPGCEQLGDYHGGPIDLRDLG
jgi:hypothetical protein